MGAQCLNPQVTTANTPVPMTHGIWTTAAVKSGNVKVGERPVSGMMGL